MAGGDAVAGGSKTTGSARSIAILCGEERAASKLRGVEI